MKSRYLAFFLAVLLGISLFWNPLHRTTDGKTSADVVKTISLKPAAFDSLMAAAAEKGATIALKTFGVQLQELEDLNGQLAAELTAERKMLATVLEKIGQRVETLLASQQQEVTPTIEEESTSLDSLETVVAMKSAQEDSLQTKLEIVQRRADTLVAESAAFEPGGKTAYIISLFKDLSRLYANGYVGDDGFEDREIALVGFLREDPSLLSTSVYDWDNHYYWRYCLSPKYGLQVSYPEKSPVVTLEAYILAFCRANSGVRRGKLIGEMYRFYAGHPKSKTVFDSLMVAANNKQLYHIWFQDKGQQYKLARVKERYGLEVMKSLAVIEPQSPMFTSR